jgi:hypothetical protein
MQPQYYPDGYVRVEEGLGARPQPADHEDGTTSTPMTEPELEPHTQNSGLVRDAIIGLADGLTVPFALTAGLSS